MSKGKSGGNAEIQAKVAKGSLTTLVAVCRSCQPAVPSFPFSAIRLDRLFFFSVSFGVAKRILIALLTDNGGLPFPFPRSERSAVLKVVIYPGKPAGV